MKKLLIFLGFLIVVGLGVEMYLLHKDMLAMIENQHYTHDLLKSGLALDVQETLNKPEDPTFLDTLKSTLGIGAGVGVSFAVAFKLTISFLKSQAIDFVKEHTVGWLFNLPWTTGAITLGAYLRFPKSSFPGKDVKSTQELVDSPYHQLLFRFMVLCRNEKILIENPGDKMGTKAQFVEGVNYDKEKFVKKLREITVQYFPQIEQERLVNSSSHFWNNVLVGDNDADMLFIIQSTFLSFVGELNEKQWLDCFNILYTKFIEFESPEPGKDTQKPQVMKLANALSFLLNKPEIKERLVSAYTEFSPEGDKSFKATFLQEFKQVLRRRGSTTLLPQA